MPMPAPIMMPLESWSKARTYSSVVQAGVFEKHMDVNDALSQQIPPVRLPSEGGSGSSDIASFTAAIDAAQAASTTQLVPPKSKRLAMRPAMTLLGSPGNAFSSQPTNAFLYL